MRYLLLCACAVLAAGGCGSGQPGLVPVSGRVYYRGRPLPGGTIVFTPDPRRGGSGPLACGEIKPDGRFVLHTEKRPGAVPGWHCVTVAPARSGAQSLPRRYSDPEQSGKCVEVRPDRANTHDIYLD
jgi:hypothetical protein